MDRKKIVFMIDVQPLEAENGEKYMKDITKQIRFCILRILTYFGGKHKESGRKGNSGPLWGYKFYKSKGGHLEYGNHHLYDLKLDDFQNFEDELEDKFQKAKEEEKLKKSLSTRVSIAEQFSCVLAEIVANFQWERPDFFSPVKSNKKANKNLKITPQMDKSFSNFVFLFTSCPGCCRDSDYFSKKYPKTSFELQNALIKDEVSQKMINDCRISFNWIDTGCQGDDTFHQILSEMMAIFSGVLVPIKNMSFWWVKQEDLKMQRACQPASFVTLMDSLLAQTKLQLDDDCNANMSISIFKLSIQLNDTTCTQATSSATKYLPVVLKNASIKRTPSNMPILPSIEMDVSNRFQSYNLEDCNEIFSDAKRIGKITGVFKSSAALSILQNCSDSYYCSFDCSQMKEDKERQSNALQIFQQLLRLLTRKKLILVVQLNHPETGNNVNACFQPWTNFSGILTIINSHLSIGIDKCSYGQNSSEQIKLVQKLIDNIQAKMVIKKQKEEKQQKYNDLLSDYINKSSSASFMQSLDHWFYDFPSHSLPSQLHQNMNQMQNVGNIQRANQRSAELFKRLKDYYKEKRCNGKMKIQDKKVTKLEDPVNEIRKLKSRSLSRSALLIENSKVVKMQKKSEDEIKGKNGESSTTQEFDENDEIDHEEFYENDNVFYDILKDGQNFSSFSTDDLLRCMKNEILRVSAQDSFQTSAKRLSRSMVFILNKINETNYETDVSPDSFLDKLFHETFPVKNEESKSVKVSRQLFRVAMVLEVAVLTKRNSESIDKNNSGIKSQSAFKAENKIKNAENRTKESKTNENGFCSHDDDDDDDDEYCDPVAEQVIEQLRPLVFLEDPGFLAKHLNTVLLPRFKSKIPDILRRIYEGLGQLVPKDIESPSKEHENADDSFEMINDADSVIFSDYGSNNPSNQSNAGFRRFASVGDIMARKRQIIVPVRSRKSTKQRPKMGYLQIEVKKEETKPSKEGWCRNLFESASDDNKQQQQQPTGSRKRKLARRYSEITASVKDTPAGKQKRHFFWKKQHKERRKTDRITDVTVIEESPLKSTIEESPIKLARGTEIFRRSQSFSCKTSPRRFYAPKRNDSMIGGLQSTPPRRRFGRSYSCLSNGSRDANGEMQCGISSEQGQFLSNEFVMQTPDKNDKNEVGIDSILSKETPKRDCDDVTITPRKRSLSIGSSPLQLMDLTPKKMTEDPVYISREFENNFEKYARRNLLELTKESSGFRCDSRLSHKPLLYSEDSMDWVTMYCNDYRIRDESPLPTIDSVSSHRESENDSSKGGSPNLFTPSREGKQPFSSPFLSASSLETLENAPIISPRLRGSKSNRETTCRKKIEISTDD